MDIVFIFGVSLAFGLSAAEAYSLDVGLRALGVGLRAIGRGAAR